jgi:hypothetical protein
MQLSGLAMLLSIAGAQPPAPLPQVYTHVNRVTWIVKDIRRPLGATAELAGNGAGLPDQLGSGLSLGGVVRGVGPGASPTRRH